MHENTPKPGSGIYLPDGTFRPNMFPDKKPRTLDFKRVTSFLEEAQSIRDDWEIGQKEATVKIYPEYPHAPIAILLASDIHYGALGTRYDLLTQYLDIVQNTPNFYLATNGDDSDSFNAIFHPSGMMENPLPPQMQARAIAQRLHELDELGKIVVMSHGNHNDSGEWGGQDWYDSFLSGFRAPIFTRGGKLTIRMPLGIEYKVVMNHQFWGYSKINPTNAPKRLLEYEGGGDADIAWLGHTHQSSFEHFSRGDKEVLAIISGTFKERDDWAAKRGIGSRGQKPGISVFLWPEEKQMQAFKDLTVAQDVLLSMIGELHPATP